MELIGYPITVLLLFFALYGFILVIAGSTYRHTETQVKKLPKIKLLLPAYKPDEVFLKVLRSIKKATKNHKVDVLILFQEADKSIVDASKKYGFPYVENRFDHLEGNSYRHALQYLCREHLDTRSHPYTLLLDKDNIMDEYFFDNLAQASLEDYDIVQGVRKPLQTSQGIQLFDAISERYNDLMLRKGKLQLGGALEISGSAAVIRTDIFQAAINRMDNQAPGYDKNFMVKLLTGEKRIQSKFSDNVIVYEEKTSEVANYQSQRLRWFGEQYFNAYYNAASLLKAAFLSGKFRSLDYLFTLIRPPRSLQLVASFALFAIDLIDLTPGFLSVPFAINSASFAIVATPILKPTHARQLITGTAKVVFSNIKTSATCLRSKYQNTFIHTR